MALSARAAPPSQPVSATNTTTGLWRVNNFDSPAPDDQDTGGILVNRLHLRAADGPLSAMARLDSALFYGLPDERFPADAHLERIGVTYRHQAWEFVVGDGFAQLGRGLLFSLRPQDDLGLDVALRGAQLAWRGRFQEVKLFAGVANSGAVDAITFARVEEVNDVIVGAEDVFTPVDGVSATFMALVVRPQSEDALAIEGASTSVGAGLEATDLFGLWTSAVEVDVQQRWSADAQGKPGTVAYLVNDLALGPVGLTAETLLVHDFRVEGSFNQAVRQRFLYNRVPTFERMGIEVRNSDELIGQRLRADWILEDLGLNLYAVGMLRQNDFLGDKAYTQGHVYGGFKEVLGDGATVFSLTLGARDERRAPEVQVYARALVHADFNISQEVARGLSLGLTTNNQWWPVGARGNAFLRGNTTASIDGAGFGGLAVELGYDGEDETPGVQQLFLAGSGSLDFGESLTIRTTIGSQRDGMRCVSGVCRFVPAFAGARAEVVARF